MSADDALKIIGLLIAAYPVPGWPQEQIDLWVDMLTATPPLDANATKRTVLEWIRTQDDRPSIAQVRRLARERDDQFATINRLRAYDERLERLGAKQVIAEIEASRAARGDFRPLLAPKTELVPFEYQRHHAVVPVDTTFREPTPEELAAADAKRAELKRQAEQLRASETTEEEEKL